MYFPPWDSMSVPPNRWFVGRREMLHAGQDFRIELLAERKSMAAAATASSLVVKFPPPPGYIVLVPWKTTPTLPLGNSHLYRTDVMA